MKSHHYRKDIICWILSHYGYIFLCMRKAYPIHPQNRDQQNIWKETASAKKLKPSSY